MTCPRLTTRSHTARAALIAASTLLHAPKRALAEFSTAAQNARTEIAIPFFTLVTYFVYAVGAVFIITGIVQAKKHSDAPMSQPLGPAIVRLFAGAAFLAIPSVIGMLQRTGFATFGGYFSGAYTIPF